MKKNLPVEFLYSSRSVRTVEIENSPWFVAKDVCDVLDYSDTEVALRKLDEDEKLIRKIYGSGQNREFWLINESGLYALILRSNKPEARSFRKWVTNEVLPAIRRRGCYKSQKTEVELQAMQRQCVFLKGVIDDLRHMLDSSHKNSHDIIEIFNQYVK